MRGESVPVTTQIHSSLPIALDTLIARAVERAGGWIGFDRFMALALYAPGLGYYANSLAKFGQMPESGSDFVTAPELTRCSAARWPRSWPRRSRRPAPPRCGNSAPARARSPPSCSMRSMPWAAAT